MNRVQMVKHKDDLVSFFKEAHAEKREKTGMKQILQTLERD